MWNVLRPLKKSTNYRIVADELYYLYKDMVVR